MSNINKFIWILRYMWSDHTTLILRMALVYYIANGLIHSLNNLPFQWYEELGNTLAYTFLFFLLYTFTVVLDLKNADSSPIFLASHIDKKISDYHHLKDICVLPNHRGCFKIHFEINNDYSTSIYYTIIDNPMEVHEQAKAFKYVLEIIGTPSLEGSIARLDRMCQETDYMLQGGKTENVVYK